MGSFIVSSPVISGLENWELNENEIKLYPNPVGDILYTNLSVGTEYFLTNSIGEIISGVESTMKNGNLVLHTSNLSHGLYLLCVKESGGIKVKKFVK